jgi:hypothetical protein
VTSMDGHGLSDLTTVREYLTRVGEEWLLKYVRERGDGRYELATDLYAEIKLPSVRYQVACIFMILGEYTIAEQIHRLDWADLSPFGDKVGNNLLKQFMRAYPPLKS